MREAITALIFDLLAVVAVLPNHVVVANLIHVLALVAAVALAAAAQAFALDLAGAPYSWLPCLARASATLCFLFLCSRMLQHCLTHSRASRSFAKTGFWGPQFLLTGTAFFTLLG